MILNVSAKIVVIKDNLNAKVESLYTEKNDGVNISTDFIEKKKKKNLINLVI